VGAWFFGVNKIEKTIDIELSRMLIDNEIEADITYDFSLSESINLLDFNITPTIKNIQIREIKLKNQAQEIEEINIETIKIKSDFSMNSLITFEGIRVSSNQNQLYLNDTSTNMQVRQDCNQISCSLNIKVNNNRLGNFSISYNIKDPIQILAAINNILSIDDKVDLITDLMVPDNKSIEISSFSSKLIAGLNIDKLLNFYLKGIPVQTDSSLSIDYTNLTNSLRPTNKYIILSFFNAIVLNATSSIELSVDNVSLDAVQKVLALDKDYIDFTSNNTLSFNLKIDLSHGLPEAITLSANDSTGKSLYYKGKVEYPFTSIIDLITSINNSQTPANLNKLLSAHKTSHELTLSSQSGSNITLEMILFGGVEQLQKIKGLSAGIKDGYTFDVTLNSDGLSDTYKYNINLDGYLGNVYIDSTISYQKPQPILDLSKKSVFESNVNLKLTPTANLKRFLADFYGFSSLSIKEVTKDVDEVLDMYIKSLLGVATAVYGNSTRNSILSVFSVDSLNDLIFKIRNFTKNPNKLELDFSNYGFSHSLSDLEKNPDLLINNLKIDLR
jgi:hypothetical protein